MQRHAFIRDLGLKSFSLRAKASENTWPSHSPCFQFYVTRVVNERESKGYRKRENMMTQPERGAEKGFTNVTWA